MKNSIQVVFYPGTKISLCLGNDLICRAHSCNVHSLKQKYTRRALIKCAQATGTLFGKMKEEKVRVISEERNFIRPYKMTLSLFFKPQLTEQQERKKKCHTL